MAGASLIRGLAGGGTTLAALRRAIFDAPADTNLVFLRIREQAPQFPVVCPNCGQGAQTPLRIRRAFLLYSVSDDDSPNQTTAIVDTLDVPFCDPCRHQQQAQRAPKNPWLPLRRIFSDGEGFGGVLVIGIALMFVRFAVEKLSVVPLIFACLPFSVGYWLIRSTWKKTAHMDLPKPTPVDLAVDFTPSMSLPFEPGWRAFEFRARPYAEMFRQLNAASLWDPNSPEARTAAQKRSRSSARTNWVIGTIVLAVLLWWLWDDVLSPFFR